MRRNNADRDCSRHPTVKAALSMKESGSGSVLPSGARGRLRAHYEQMWSGAIPRIRAGTIEVDSVLAAGEPDRRRGLTVVARPSPAVRSRVVAFLSELWDLEPGQYYYDAAEFHVTVLSLFTASANHRPFFAQKERFVAAVDSALRRAGSLGIDFAGVTVSRGTVMIQGFFEKDALNGLRDRLRRQLREHGLGAGVDQRYRLQTAHMTVVRFRAPLHDGERFAAVLEGARHRPFGSVAIRSLSLVAHDWYMSRRVTKVVKRYRLTCRRRGHESSGTY